LAQRQLVPPGSATMKAIDYSLKRWTELTRFVEDGDVPISNNWVENHIRPIALGRSTDSGLDGAVFIVASDASIMGFTQTSGGSTPHKAV